MRNFECGIKSRSFRIHNSELRSSRKRELVGMDDSKAELANDDQAALQVQRWPCCQETQKGCVHGRFPLARPLHDDDAVVCGQWIANDVGEILVFGDEHNFLANGCFEDGVIACAGQAELLESGYAVAEFAQQNDRGAANALISEKVGQSEGLLLNEPLRA